MRGKTEVLVETTLLIIRVFSFRTTKTKVSSLLVPYSLPSLFIPVSTLISIRALQSFNSHLSPIPIRTMQYLLSKYKFHVVTHLCSYHAVSHLSATSPVSYLTWRVRPLGMFQTRFASRSAEKEQAVKEERPVYLK